MTYVPSLGQITKTRTTYTQKPTSGSGSTSGTTTRTGSVRTGTPRGSYIVQPSTVIATPTGTSQPATTITEAATRAIVTSTGKEPPTQIVPTEASPIRVSNPIVAPGYLPRQDIRDQNVVVTYPEQSKPIRGGVTLPPVGTETATPIVAGSRTKVGLTPSGDVIPTPSITPTPNGGGSILETAVKALEQTPEAQAIIQNLKAQAAQTAAQNAVVAGTVTPSGEIVPAGATEAGVMTDNLKYVLIALAVATGAFLLFGKPKDVSPSEPIVVTRYRARRRRPRRYPRR